MIGIESYLKNRLPTISEDSINLFKTITKPKSFLKGDILLTHGKISPLCYIITNGLVASFIRNEDGSDFIRTFYKSMDEVGSLKSLIKKEKSTASYRCLIDCDAYELDFLDFLEKSKNNIEFHQLHIKILEKVYLDSEKRISELSSFDATQRYIALKNDITNIDNLLPQYQIANYLNVTPVQLSRIRKKILS